MEKRLHLSSKDKKIAGVCGGFAEFFGIDPTLIRIAWLFLAFFAGSGILLYLVCWFVMPQELAKAR